VSTQSPVPEILVEPPTTEVGGRINLTAYPPGDPSQWTYDWMVFPNIINGLQDADKQVAYLMTDSAQPGVYDIRCRFIPTTSPVMSTLGVALGPGAAAVSQTVQTRVTVSAAGGPVLGNVVPVSLQRTSVIESADQALWVIIRNRTEAIAFNHYKEFVDGVMCSDAAGNLAFRGSDAYDLLKVATNAFLMHEAGILDPDLYSFGKGVRHSITGQLPHGAANALLDPQTAIESLPLDAQAFNNHERTRLGFNADRAWVERQRQLYYEQIQNEQLTLLPYMKIIRDRLSDIPIKPAATTPANCYGILKSHIQHPLAIELIWNYWHEEGGLAQTLNAILIRFQNRKLRRGVDPLTRFDLDPLRPLANLLWGWVQDEVPRLTVRRRAYEYDHEYGLRLVGGAVPPIRSVDRRSSFLEAFHNLLYLTHVFYKEDDDTTVIADPFPVLNSLREVHILLAEGAHNQFGDLPSTARAEMLIMEWLLARPETREYLGGRPMVPYEEAWMDRVDTMKSMQGWTEVTITHFRDLGVFGEQLLLSIRYGNWSVSFNDPQQAANWARYFRPEVQRYTHAYRAATGVDLTERVDATLPALLLQRREATRRRA
jgi:hypothetical protein